MVKEDEDYMNMSCRILRRSRTFRKVSVPRKNVGKSKWFNETRRKKFIDVVNEIFQQLSERQENEEVRAIYGANSYSVDTTYKSFRDEETKTNHIKKMRNYTSAPSDAFDKPTNAGRKPSSIIRSTKEQPTQVLVDRIQNSQETSGSWENIRLHISKSPATNEWRYSPSETEKSSNIRFPDPCNDRPKIFELHMKKDLSKSVKRCRGNCGRVISNDDTILVKLYGTIQ